MMQSFQKEIPKARVNITLDLETGDAQKKTELPLKLLMLGSFSQGNSALPLEQRSRINVNKENIDHVMNEITPVVNFVVPDCIKNNGESLSMTMRFSSIKDFRPEKIVEKIPELKYLLAMRHLLRDLKSNVLDNRSLRRVLDKMMQDKKDLNTVSQQLKVLTKPV